MTTLVELRGLDGGNPLGFLAALGTLRTLTLAWPDADVRMSWAASDAWHPGLHLNRQMADAQLIDALEGQLRDDGGRRAFDVADDLKLTPEKFAAHAMQAALTATQGDRRCADFVAAFGCEATANKGVIQDTALRTMSGTGHQHFLKFMRELSEQTNTEHLRSALFEPWTYADLGLSMRWDAADDRRYALRWANPSGDKILTVRGANRLAIEALPLFPTAPVGRKLATTGFTGQGSRDTFWTWPIWQPALALDTIRSLLALSELQLLEPPRHALDRRGIVQVYRSQRLTIGKYRNFTPARAI